MQCHQCGQTIPDQARFCLDCGASQALPPPVYQPPLVEVVRPRVISPPAGFLVLGGIIGFVVCAIAVGAAYYLGALSSGSTNNRNVNVIVDDNLRPDAGRPRDESTFPMPPPPPTPMPRTVVDSSFPVDSSQYVSHGFTCPNACDVSGRFRAEGGRNDIEVYILDEIGFSNMQNRNRARTYYNSGRVTVDQIRVRLPAGNYYLIFDNTEALMTPKVVVAEVTVQ